MAVLKIAEVQEKKYQWYLERVKEMRALAMTLSDGIDKLTFGLAGGALVLSVNFVDKFIGEGVYIYILLCAWILLLLSLILNLLTFPLALKDNSNQKRILDEWLWSDEVKAPPIKGTWVTWGMNLCHYGSMALMIAGLIALTLYASLNLETIRFVTLAI